MTPRRRKERATIPLRQCRRRRRSFPKAACGLEEKRERTVNALPIALRSCSQGLDKLQHCTVHTRICTVGSAIWLITLFAIFSYYIFILIDCSHLRVLFCNTSNQFSVRYQNFLFQLYGNTTCASVAVETTYVGLLCSFPLN